MSLRRAACASLFLLLPSLALAQSGSFTLLQGGRAIGKDVYKLDKSKNGFRLTSRYDYHINGVDASISDDFKYDGNYGFLDGGTSNIASQTHQSFQPDGGRTLLRIGTVQAGAQDSKSLAVKPNFTLLPGFDPGSAQLLLLMAVLHPSAGNLYNVVVPAAGGAGAPPSNSEAGPVAVSGGNFAYDALWTKGADATGTLDGKPVALHSYTLKAGNNTWTFYADDANLLMQCDVTALRASYVRQKFVLAQ